MADMPSLSERDLSSKTHSKLLPPLYSSPRVSGGTLGLSSSLTDAEEPPAAGPAIDYRDVFGGPPRYAASAFASQHGSLPTLEDVFSRSSSFKTSLPTYELPVFGDDSPGSRTYDLRPASSFSEDLHRRSESHDPFASPNLARGHATGASQSKPSSRSASRRMSPAHPAAQLERQLTDEMPFGSTVFSRSSGRKPLESPFTASTPDPSISSLPSSPPHASLWSHLKRSTRSKLGDTIRRSSDMEVDDVFGGFPRRSFPQALNNETYRSNSESGVSGTVDPDFPSSVFSADEQGLAAGDFIEISMDRYRKPSTQQIAEANSQKTQMTMNESYFAPHPSVKPSPSRPPTVPAVQLKVKSWKDWASDFPKSQSVSFSSTCDSSIEGTTSPTSVAEREEAEDGDAHSTYVKDWVEASSGCLSGQQTHRNSSAQHSRKNSSELLAANGNKLKSTSAEDTVGMEEKELQDLLIKAWKINEQREREKMIAQQRREAYVKEKELQWKELRRQPYKLAKASRTQQERQLDQESKEPAVQLKEEKPFVSNERKVAESPTSKVLSSNSQLLAELQEKVVKLAERKARSYSQESSCRVGFTGDVNDEAGAESFVTSSKHSTSNGAFEAGLETEGKENVAAAQEMREVNVNDVSESSINQKSPVTQVHVDEPEKDSLQSGEQDDISLSETLEDSNVSLDGFQEIEGESSERRASRWERHVRASRRAAKALEEKQQRDAEVQREQEEKQQLAETLDRSIKRWAAGKEGNLRALLSNLQHVLWSDCGWQPIPLSDLIEGADVKKAYRKATLFVHPDKVQQKGATAQQKYIAERVFDVLQEAWKTFNLQELF